MHLTQSSIVLSAVWPRGIDCVLASCDSERGGLLRAFIFVLEPQPGPLLHLNPGSLGAGISLIRTSINIYLPEQSTLVTTR